MDSTDSKLTLNDDSKRIEFFVHGFPKAQPRVKATQRGKHAGVYTPSTANGWKALIAQEAKQYLPEQPMRNGCRVDVIWLFPRTKKLQQKKIKGVEVPTCRIAYTKKPDRDNLDKAPLDILTQLGFFSDDCIIYSGELAKFYVGAGESPGMYIRIREMETLSILRTIDFCVYQVLPAEML
jgi:Holliday junction resolvase RusA-like endonuclease